MPSKIDALIPEDGPADLDGLRAHDPAGLASYAADPAGTWWRRCTCASALAGRVPEQWAGPLMDRVRDRADVSEVREALLEIVGNRPELADWLAEDHSGEGHDLAEAILRTRGTNSDRSVLPALTTLAFDNWSHRRATGQAGLDALVTRYGTAALLTDLDGTRPEDRAFRLRLRHRTGQDVTEGFADADRRVAYLAATLVSDAEQAAGAADHAPTAEAAIWAAWALSRLTGDRQRVRAVDERLGRPRVEVPGLDQETRRAIVNEYGAGCEQTSDPRWRLEAASAGRPRRLTWATSCAGRWRHSGRRAWPLAGRCPPKSTTSRAAAPIT